MENNRPFFSIIMPVYNCANDVGRMIESVRAQKFQDWELIVIDDCSTDDTRQSVCEYIVQDSRIILLEQETNGGPGKTKNRGIQHSRGQYITFVDADDWIEKETYEKICENIKCDTDVVVYGLCRDICNEKNEVQESNKIYMPATLIKTKKELIYNIPEMDQRRVFAYACNKVYRKEIVDKHNIRFSDKRFGEDYDFNIEFFRYAENAVIIENAFYHYIKKNTESLTERFLPNYYEINRDRFKKMKKLMQDYNSYSQIMRQKIMTSYVRHALMAVARLYDKRGKITAKARRIKTKNILQDELTKEAIRYSKSDTFAGKVCNGILKMKNVTVILIFGKLLWVIQNDAKGIYEKINK